MNESPFSNEWIEDMLNSGRAAQLWPSHERQDTSKDWVHALLATLGLSDQELDFFGAVAAGHTTADAARLAGRGPRWGRKLLARVRNDLTKHSDTGH